VAGTGLTVESLTWHGAPARQRYSEEPQARQPQRLRTASEAISFDLCAKRNILEPTTTEYPRADRLQGRLSDKGVHGREI
jgi:hypothetical protein